MAVALTIDYRTLAQRSLIFYGILVVALIYVAINGDTRMGAQRWMSIWRFSLQPSEFGRLIMALVLALVYGDNRRGARTMPDLAIGAVVLAVPLLLILEAARSGHRGHARARLPRRRLCRRHAVKWLAVAGWRPCSCRRWPGCTSCRTIKRNALKRSSIRPRTPRARGSSRSRRKVTVGSGGFLGKGFQKGSQGA
jgi:hypothetical protein